MDLRMADAYRVVRVEVDATLANAPPGDASLDDELEYWRTRPRGVRTQVKRAIEKGNIDGAKIHAQDAIRKKNEALNMLRLVSRLDGVVARLETQVKMNMVNKDMKNIVKSLEKSLNANNLIEVSETMDSFEKQFENLDVQTEVMQDAMGNTTAMSTPPEDVAMLMQQIADEHGLELASDLPAAGTTVPEAAQKDADLANRLATLRG
jgi:charged multivesicular body protein 1